MYKDEIALQYEAQVMRLRTEGRIIFARVMNTVEDEHKKMFQSLIAQGGLPEIEITGETIKNMMWQSAQKVLTPADVQS